MVASTYIIIHGTNFFNVYASWTNLYNVYASLIFLIWKSNNPWTNYANHDVILELHQKWEQRSIVDQFLTNFSPTTMHYAAIHGN